MPLTAELTTAAIAASRQNALEAADALSRALGNPIELLAEEIVAREGQSPSEDWGNPGLVIVLNVEQEGVLCFLPAASGLLPSWYQKPDPTGVSKLTTLAQELGMVLLPEDAMPLDFAAGYVDSFTAALERSECQTVAGFDIPLVSGEQRGVMSLVWPAKRTSAVFVPAPRDEAKPAPPTNPAPPPVTQGTEEEFEAALLQLPPYIRSLLQIKTAVAVQLATCKQPVSRIVDLGPGSIIQFNRQCEQPLELFVNNLKIAEGEVVKVGDKFGFRITNMTLPHERFLPLQLIPSRKAS